jgi:hypothetical protein
LELVFYTEFNDVNQAIAFEKQVKDWSRKKKEAIINDNGKSYLIFLKEELLINNLNKIIKNLITKSFESLRMTVLVLLVLNV